MAELRVLEDSTMERADARWVRLRCSDCDLMVEARITPASRMDAFIAVCRAGHDQLHDEGVVLDAHQ